MAPARAGVFAANAGLNAPAHTAQVDYLVSTANRIEPEDGAPAAANYIVDVDAAGNGTVTKNPDQANYTCGTLITLAATPAAGYSFSGWSGSLTAMQNPVTIAANQNKAITGNFIVNVPPAISNLQVAPGDNWATVSWTTNEPSTTAVAFGRTSSYELGTTTVAGMTTHHAVYLTNLSPQATYFLRVTSTDVDGGSSTSDVTTATLPAFALQVSNVVVTPAETTATVSWQTNKPTSGAVRLGLTMALEMPAVPAAGPATSHAVTLSGLSGGTQYNYRIEATDTSGVAAQSPTSTFTTRQIAPMIKLWHGDTQRFGNIGIPQRWINVLGNVADPDGVRYLHFSLNGGPLRPLGIGPDTRRLQRPGDFNVEIDFNEANAGINLVRIVARDTLDNVSEKTVTIDVTKDRTWPASVDVNFSTVTNVEDVAQVVDGKWSLQGGALRSIETGYDRLVAIGDVSWKNYEATAYITAHSFDPAGYAPPSYGAVVGLVVRWKGHEIWDNMQPSWGYWPAGATMTYGWNPDGSERVALIGNQDNQVSVKTANPRLEFNRSYVYKVRVETEATGQHRYRFKMWPADSSEPAVWQHQIRNGNRPDDPTSGSLLLFSHNVDASFERVTVTRLPDATPIDTTAPPNPTDVMVVAPHPDDDLIIAAGVMKRALQRGQSVRIVFATNGDVEGVNYGLVRQAEAVDGASMLGVPENRLVFLSYPTSGLNNLRLFYTDPDDQFVSGSGTSATYGTRGLGGADYHKYRFGAPGKYNWPTMVADLADLIHTTRPTHIFTTGSWETHTDHSSTYWLVKDAVEQVSSMTGGAYRPTVHASTVWPDEIRDDGPWPAPADPTAYFTEPPHSDPSMPPWSERESLDVPSSMQVTDLGANLKFRAIAEHFTQFSSGYIAKFVHKDEFFWTEVFTTANQPPVPNAGTDRTVNGGALVTLNGTGSWDRNGSSVGYQWRQVGGPPVALSSTTSGTPSFVAPGGLSVDTILEFELVVNDGSLFSVPDGVRVIVRRAQ